MADIYKNEDVFISDMDIDPDDIDIELEDIIPEQLDGDMVDIYKDWGVFISNIDIVPEQLDGEKLMAMVSVFSHSHEEREMLRKEAAAGDKFPLETLINSYIPMVVESMKKYAPQAGYNRDIFMNCVEKVQERVVNTLYLDDFKYNMSRYIDWMVKNEVTHYITSQESITTPKENDGLEDIIPEQLDDDMVDIYKNWDVFISNMDIAPEQLDGEKLMAMVSVLSHSHEEREMLRKEAAAGDKFSLETLIISYIPMVVENMKKYVSWVGGYNRNIFMNCVEKLRERVVNTLYLDEFKYNTSHYISWMVKNEVFKDILLHYGTERERQVFIFAYGWEDGVPKTNQETADKFGISIDRVLQIKWKILYESGFLKGHRRSKRLKEFLDS